MNTKTLVAGDVCLLYVEDMPVGFLHINDISPDVKPGWWVLTLTSLQIPLSKFTWQLDNDHLNQKTFEMKGIPRRLQAVSRVEEPKKPKVSDSVPEKPKDSSDSFFG